MALHWLPQDGGFSHLLQLWVIIHNLSERALSNLNFKGVCSNYRSQEVCKVARIIRGWEWWLPFTRCGTYKTNAPFSTLLLHVTCQAYNKWLTSQLALLLHCRVKKHAPLCPSSAIILLHAFSCTLLFPLRPSYKPCLSVVSSQCRVMSLLWPLWSVSGQSLFHNVLAVFGPAIALPKCSLQINYNKAFCCDTLLHCLLTMHLLMRYVQVHIRGRLLWRGGDVFILFILQPWRHWKNDCSSANLPEL